MPFIFKMKKEQVRLTPEQKEKIICMVFFGFSKSVVLRRMREEEGLDLASNSYTKYRRWVDEHPQEALEAVGRQRQKIFERGYADRMTRLEALYAQADKLQQTEINGTLDLQRVTDGLRKTLKQVAQELQEWQTGGTVNINVFAPVFNELAFVLARHIPEGPARDLALADLRQASERYLRELPDGKEIKARVKKVGAEVWHSPMP